MIDRLPAAPARATTINRLTVAPCTSIFMCTCVDLQSATYLPCSPSQQGPAELSLSRQKMRELLHKKLQLVLVFQPFSAWTRNLFLQLLIRNRSDICLCFLSKSSLAKFGAKTFSAEAQFKGTRHWFKKEVIGSWEQLHTYFNFLDDSYFSMDYSICEW